MTLTGATTVAATFALQSVTLTVSETGAGSGTVTSAPAGINCGATCSWSYSSGSALTLTAAPATGSIFTGWSGGGCSGTGACVVTLTGATTVTAAFALQPVSLTVSKTGAGSGTVTSAPAGINCGATCSWSYTSGTALTLTAVPATGSSFTGWSGGGCSGTGACTVTLTAEASVTAGFGLQSAAISFVQGNYAVPQTPQASVSVTFPVVQTAGNLNVVIIGWNDSRASIKAVTDTAGNAYTLAVGPTTRAGTVSQSIYFAKNIRAAATNRITVTFTVAAIYPDVRILEYSGLDTDSPLHATAAGSGSGTTSSSGSLKTSAPNVLLVAGNLVRTFTSGPGSGFTNRMITSPDGDIAQDRVVSTAGTYSATARLTSSGYWVMQLVAFKARTSP